MHIIITQIAARTHTINAPLFPVFCFYVLSVNTVVSVILVDCTALTAVAWCIFAHFLFYTFCLVGIVAFCISARVSFYYLFVITYRYIY